MNWPDSPRDWSPRMAESLKYLEQLKAAVPAKFQVERGGLWELGKDYEVQAPLEDDGSGGEVLVIAKIVLLVRIPDDRGIFDRTWLYSNGRILVGLDTCLLLRGQIEGYEHLADRWPWPGFGYGPPDRKDPLGRHT